MAFDRTIEIGIIALDYATSVFNNVSRSVSAFAGTAGSGIAKFSDKAYKGIKSADDALRKYNNSMSGFNSMMTGVLTTAGRAVYNFTTDAIQQFAELERQHAKTMGVLSANYDFNWSGDNTAEQLKNMEQFYRDAEGLKEQAYTFGSAGPTGKGALYGPVEISAAQLSLSRAGISADDMLNTDIVETIIKFAGGNDISVDDAVAYGVQLGAQFDKKPDEWGSMFDQITAAANMAPIDVTDVMQSLKQAGNMAAGYDVPLSDVLSAIVIMGKSGLKGSQAGSGISAIFTRSMNPTGVTTASKAPTANVEAVYDEFKSKVVDDHGMFNGLGDFTEELQGVLDGLTDEELSWFCKKMFGMFQTKAALALGRTQEDTESTFGYIADVIENNSEGINDALYDLILESSGGQIEALQNVWDTTKMRFGDAISPMTKEVTKQLIAGLTTGNFNIDVDGLQEALDEAVARTNDQFGEQISSLVEDLGNLGINSTQIGMAELPLLAGSGEAILKFFSGDFDGAWQAFTNGLDATNEEIEKLPPELQGTAEGLKNLIVLFEGLFALNIVTTIAQFLTSVAVFVGGFVGGLATIIGTIKTLVGGLAGASAAKSATDALSNMNMNANYVQVNSSQVGTAQFGAVNSASFGAIANVTQFMATTTNMTVNAANVVVNGGSGLGNGNGSGGGGGALGGGGSSPTLIDVNGNPLSSIGSAGAEVTGTMLEYGAKGAAMAIGGQVAKNAMLTGGQQLLLGSGATGAQLFLPEAVATAGGAGAAGAAEVATATGATVRVANTLSMASQILGIAGSVGMLLSMSGSTADESKQFAGYYNAGMEAGLSGQALKDYVMQKAYDSGYHNLPEGEFSIYKDTAREGAAGAWFDNTMSNIATQYSTDALDAVYNYLVDRINSGEKITEDFLKGLSSAVSDELGVDVVIDQNALSNILETLFDTEFKTGSYMGSYADQNVDKFIRENIGKESDAWRNNGTYKQLLAVLTGVLDGYQYVDGTDNIYQDAKGAQFKLTDDGRLVEWDNAAIQMAVAADNLTTAADSLITSARDMASELVTSGAIDVLDLGQGPLSNQGAIDYLTNAMTGNAGISMRDMVSNLTNPSIMMSNSATNRLASSMSGNSDIGPSTGIAQIDDELSEINSVVNDIAQQLSSGITDDNMRAAFMEGFYNYDSVLDGSISDLNMSTISLSEAVSTLCSSPAFVNGLGKGPMSSDGAYAYIMSQLASGTEANSQLLQNIQSGISALDPQLTVDITNRAPVVNVNVDVKVDQAGKVTKTVIPSLNYIDNYLYKASQRFGTSLKIER